jgi:HK97 family phage major capsid protein
VTLVALMSRGRGFERPDLVFYPARSNLDCATTTVSAARPVMAAQVQLTGGFTTAPQWPVGSTLRRFFRLRPWPGFRRRGDGLTTNTLPPKLIGTVMDNDDVRSLTYSQCRARLGTIYARMGSLGAKHRMSRADEAEFDRMTDEVTAIDEHRRSLERADSMAKGRGGAGLRYETERDGIDPYADERDDSRDDPRRGHRDAAMRTVDTLVAAEKLPARSAEVVEGLVRTGNPGEQSHTARLVAALGDDAYARAFAKMGANPTQGHLTWTARESEAFRTVEQLRSETRAMNTVDVQGGFLIPLQIDPAVLISSAGSNNPLRQIARTVTTSTDQWSGITSAGVTAEWIAEGAQVADASPSLGQPTIPVYKADAFIPFSFEIASDGLLFMDEIGKLLVDGLTQLSNQSFTTGSGQNQPSGIISSLSAGSAPSVVSSAASGVLAIGDVYNLQNQLPARFSAGAQWCAHLGILNTLRQFVTGTVLAFPGLQNDPATLLARNANELSNMTNGTAHTSYPLVYGDWYNFVIVDRWPSSLEFIPNLFGPQGRPTGQRGAFLWSRLGSDCVVPNSFRLLAC